jgi:hypothetical protein
MNVRATVNVERDPIRPEQAWPKTCHVRVELELTDAERGEAVVGAVEKALNGARRIAVESLRASA